jgi:hypothetical protein
MENVDAANAAAAKTKNGAELKMLGSMFTSVAKEKEATARKTTKVAVNRLKRLSKVCRRPVDKLLCAAVLVEVAEIEADVEGAGWAARAGFLRRLNTTINTAEVAAATPPKTRTAWMLGITCPGVKYPQIVRVINSKTSIAPTVT